MEKILISGANGFIGSMLSGKLSQKYDVTCLVRKNADTSLIPYRCHIFKVDYSDTQTLQEIFDKSDVFIHCAAATRAKNWEQIKKINVALTRQMIDATNKSSQMKQFIFLSSQAASGYSKPNIPKTEDDVCNPISLYGKSKLAAENTIKQHCKIPYTIIRPASVYGEGDKDFLQYFKLIKKHLAFFTGFDSFNISLIYVKSLINLIDLTILNKMSYNEIFFASDGIYTLSEFVKNLEEITKIKAIKIKIPLFILDIIAFFAQILSIFHKRPLLLNKEKVKEIKIRWWIVSNEKAKEILRFEPSDNILNNLSNTYNWYKKNDRI